MCILLVEDEAIISMVVKEVLEDAGHEVLAAYTGDSAVQHVIGMPGRFSFLITDFNLPGRLNGIDVVNWARSSYPEIPVILATALGHIISRSWLRRQRVNLVNKPYSPSALVMMVQRSLGAA